MKTQSMCDYQEFRAFVAVYLGVDQDEVDRRFSGMRDLALESGGSDGICTEREYSGDTEEDKGYTRATNAFLVEHGVKQCLVTFG